MQNLLFRRTPCAMSHLEWRQRWGRQYPSIGSTIELRKADRAVSGALVMGDNGIEGTVRAVRSR